MEIHKHASNANSLVSFWLLVQTSEFRFAKVKGLVCFCEMQYTGSTQYNECDWKCISNEICGGFNKITVLNTKLSKTY